MAASPAVSTGISPGCSVGVWPVPEIILDAAAAAFISARQAAGETWTGAMKAALNAFVEGEKASGRWASIKRLYLPTSGIAAANAIDLVTLTSGTWIGGVTHGSGFVKGNGSTGRFTTDYGFPDVGQTATSAWMGGLRKAAGSAYPESMVNNGVDTGVMDWNAGGLGILFDLTNAVGGRLNNTNINAQTGVISAVVLGTNQMSRRRTSGGLVGSASRTTSGMDTIDPADVMFMGISGWVHGNSEWGAFWLGTGVSDADDAAFTLALKTLWETLTGLALP